MYFISVAKLTASLSYCKKLQVGAIAVKDKRIICTGYNGTLPGHDNCCEEEIIGENGLVTLSTKDSVEHAERNLIGYAARKGIALEGAYLYITHAPCEPCARAIANSGFSRVFFTELYKTDAGLLLLKNLGIETCQLKPY